MTILPFGLIGGLFRFYPEYKKDIKALTGTILSFLLIVAVLYCLILFLLKNIIISSVFNNQTSFSNYTTINVLIVIGSMLFSFSMSILRCLFKKTIFLVLSLINISLLVILGFIFVYYEKMGVIGFLGLQIITVSIKNYFRVFSNSKKHYRLNWNRIIFKHLFYYSSSYIRGKYIISVSDLSG